MKNSNHAILCRNLLLVAAGLLVSPPSLANEIPKPPPVTALNTPIADVEIAQAIAVQLHIQPLNDATISKADISDEEVRTLMNTVFGAWGLRRDFTGNEEQQRAGAANILIRLPEQLHSYRSYSIEPAMRELNDGSSAETDLAGGCGASGKPPLYSGLCRMFNDRVLRGVSVYVETAAQLVEMRIVSKDWQSGYLNLATVAMLANEAVTANFNRLPPTPLPIRLKQLGIRPDVPLFRPEIALPNAALTLP